MECIERLITVLLDGKFASYDAKKELSKSLGIRVEDVLGFELLTNDCDSRQGIIVTLNKCVLSKDKLDAIDFTHITSDMNGNIIIVFYDELS